MADDIVKKPDAGEALSVVAIEAEELLAALSDRHARYAELVAVGTPPPEAAARAQLTEDEARVADASPGVVAAIGALRERNLLAAGDSTDRGQLRRMLLAGASVALRREDVRGLVQVVARLADLDGLDRAPKDVNVQNHVGSLSIIFGPSLPTPPAEDAIDVTPRPEVAQDAPAALPAPMPDSTPRSRQDPNSDLASWLEATTPRPRVRTAGGRR